MANLKIITAGSHSLLPPSKSLKTQQCYTG